MHKCIDGQENPARFLYKNLIGLWRSEGRKSL